MAERSATHSGIVCTVLFESAMSGSVQKKATHFTCASLNNSDERFTILFIDWDHSNQSACRSIRRQKSFVSIVREIRVAFCSAKDAKNATFAERKATIKTRTMLSHRLELAVQRHFFARPTLLVTASFWRLIFPATIASFRTCVVGLCHDSQGSLANQTTPRLCAIG